MASAHSAFFGWKSFAASLSLKELDERWQGGYRAIFVRSRRISLGHDDKEIAARSGDPDPLVERNERIWKVFPDVRMEHKIGTVIGDRNIRSVGGDIDRGKTPAHFQLRLFEKFVVERISISGQPDVPGFEAKRVVRGRANLQALQPIEEFRWASLDSGKMVDDEG